MVIAIDVGTSSARASVYDAAARAVPGRFHQVKYEPRVTPDGGMELDAPRLLEAVAECVDHVLAGPALEVQAVAVATFWHGLLGLDAAGEAVTPLFMWADRRSAEDAAILRGALDDAAVHARTGCHLHSSYWPAKLRWLGHTRPAEARRVARWGSFGELLEQRLFGEAATSVCMASGTGLLDQQRTRWDPEALAAAGVEADRLWPLCDRAEARRGLRAPWSRRWPALRRVPWLPAVADGAASNVGSDCVGPQRIALNVGTSAALRIVTTSPPAPPPGLWRYRLDRQRSMLGGATSEGGNVLAWLDHVLRLPAREELETALAAMEPDAHHLTVLPFLAGERAPGWRDGLRATIAGLTLDTTGVDLARAGLEAVALRLARVHDLLRPCAAPDAAVVASGGGIVHSPAWAQIIADALGCPLVLSPEDEATSRGAARLALDALGITGLDEAPPLAGRTIAPDPARHARYQEARARQQRLDDAVGKV
ncbi:MAG: gluconokinase [Candidatus Rokubacteria bacterium]|nr:gluconokinase [Candidatus Rokubacteria bacterium]